MEQGHPHVLVGLTQVGIEMSGGQAGRSVETTTLSLRPTSEHQQEPTPSKEIQHEV